MLAVRKIPLFLLMLDSLPVKLSWLFPSFQCPPCTHTWQPRRRGREECIPRLVGKRAGQNEGLHLAFGFGAQLASDSLGLRRLLLLLRLWGSGKGRDKGLKEVSELSREEGTNFFF